MTILLNIALGWTGGQSSVAGNGVELLILVPYFSVLLLLAVFGLHRFHLIRLYRRHRAVVAAEPSPPAEWPRVTVQLPVFNEKYVAGRVLQAAAQLDYPPDRLEIQVLDDSTDDTTEVVRAAVERLAGEGVPIVHLHRTHRTGYKAGALAEGLREASGEFVAVFDADFIPPEDFLRRTVPHFSDSRIGMVQARWTFLNRDYSMLTRVQAMLLDAHFVLEHGARSRAGLFFNFNGTAGVWRRAAIEDAGGWQHDTLTEDTDLSYRAQLAGWRFVYLPGVECPSELPVDINAFKTQQARWAKGLIQTAKKLLPRILRANLPVQVKLEAAFHLTSAFAYPLLLLLSLLLVPTMVVRISHGVWQMMWLDLPMFLGATCSVAGFYLYAHRELYPRRWKRGLLLLPGLMAVGVGLAVRNTRAVWEALAGRETSFERTPKYSIVRDARAWFRMGYRSPRRVWLPWVELALGAYFFWASWFAVSHGHMVSSPFIALFLWGYGYTGLLSLTQPMWARISFAART